LTIGIAWVGRRSDGREHLYLASDSRVRAGGYFDAAPKILILPRSDCALAFAGTTDTTYPFMIQMAYAIAAHEPSRERALDIGRVKDHLLRVFTDFVNRDARWSPFEKTDAQFICRLLLAAKGFQYLDDLLRTKEKRFSAREAVSFNARLSKAAFIGDWAKRVRSKVAKSTSGEGAHVYMEPLGILADILDSSSENDTIGGPPQLLRISLHMNSRPLCVRWKGEDTLFGRPLFDYENTDYWIVEPHAGQFYRPRKFGHRIASGTGFLITDEPDD
jgi:hypothetical protein